MTARLFNYFLILLLSFMAAAASFHGFYSKWGMQEGHPAFNLKAMFEGTAERPWAYRQLLPATATAIDAAIPQSLRERVTDKVLQAGERMHFDRQYEQGPPLAQNPVYAVRYYLVYCMAFAALFAASLTLICLCRQYGISLGASLLGALFFVLLLPFLQSKGGYYYDLSELFFMAAYLVLLSNRRWLIGCLPLAVLATVNKESFLFFIVTTLPLCLTYGAGWRGMLRDRMAVAITVLAAGASALTHAVMMPAFAHTAGSEALFWLEQNFYFFIDPRSLLLPEQTYGLIAFAGYSPVTLILIIGVVLIGLPRLPVKIRAYAGVAALINLPLFFMFAYPGETRNLSFLFPVMVLCLAASFERLLAMQGLPDRPA